MNSLLSNPYTPWVLPLILMWVFSKKFAHPYADVLISSFCILFSVDLLIHPPLLNLESSGVFGGSTWFNPNVTSTSLALIIAVLPDRFRFAIGAKEVLVHFLLVSSLIGILVLASESLLGMGAFFAMISYRIMKRFSFTRLNISTLAVMVIFAISLNIEHIARSLQVRFEIWKITLNIIGENLWQGIGAGNFARYFLAFRSEDYSNLKGWGKIQIDPHNLVLNMLVTFGVLGSILITATLIMGIRRLSSLQQFSRDEIFLYSIFFGQSLINVNSVFVTAIFLYCANYLRCRKKSENEDYS